MKRIIAGVVIVYQSELEVPPEVLVHWEYDNLSQLLYVLSNTQRPHKFTMQSDGYLSLLSTQY